MDSFRRLEYVNSTLKTFSEREEGVDAKGGGGGGESEFDHAPFLVDYAFLRNIL